MAPRVIGIDDWAWRKGHRYGTIICDLERYRVIDLLPDREAGTVEAWLAERPGIEIVSRERGGGADRLFAVLCRAARAGRRPMASARERQPGVCRRR